MIATNARVRAVGAAVLFATAASAAALDLTVTHFGTGMYGAPFAVARDKGYFKEAGIDVTGFITSDGGGTTIRNALASEIPYGEVALPAAIAAIQQGLEITIVHSGVVSVSDQVWVSRKDDTRIARVADLKGKKLGYSSPKSVTDMVTTMMLNANGLTGQVERKSVGGIGAGLTALREGGVDMTYVTEPVWSKERNNYRLVFNSVDWAPHITQTVGIVKTDYLKKNPDKIRALINARRKGVDYLVKNPGEAAKIMAREYKIDEAAARSAIDSILAVKGTYWSTGKFDMEGMNEMLKGLVLVKAIDAGPFEWSKVMDDQYLPADQRGR